MFYLDGRGVCTPVYPSLQRCLHLYLTFSVHFDVCNLTIVTAVRGLERAGVHVEHLDVTHVRTTQNELKNPH